MRKKRAIVYDDEPLILGLLSDILSLKDYEVFSFSEPQVCPIYKDNIESCDNLHPCADVLITDIMMPGINGIDLLLKQAQRGCKIDIRNKAVISGTLTYDYKKMITDMNIKYFHKPFAFSDINNWLDECEQRIDLSKEVGIKRKHDRSPSRIKIKYDLPFHDRKFEGIVTNISKGGFCLATRDPIIREETIVIDTELPTACQEATVRWVSIQADSSFTAGLSCH
jgi:YesN/AraC family two-component response regulator